MLISAELSIENDHMLEEDSTSVKYSTTDQ